MNSKQKGKRGEREVAHLLQGYGYDARRGQQYCGANGDADVVGLPHVHIEVKRTEQLSIYKAMQQARDDARETEMPTVWHKRNRKDWLVVLSVDDFMRLYEGTYGNDNVEKHRDE